MENKNQVKNVQHKSECYSFPFDEKEILKIIKLNLYYPKDKNKNQQKNINYLTKLYKHPPKDMLNKALSNLKNTNIKIHNHK